MGPDRALNNATVLVDYGTMGCGPQQHFTLGERGQTRMKFLERTLASAAENLALDEALLLEAEMGQYNEVLRVWEWPAPVVVLGSGCRLAQDVQEAACERDGVPVLRRSSGGGTVLLGQGCLAFSLVLCLDRAPELGEIRSSYRYILGEVSRALASVAPGIEVAGISDLAVGGLKCSGNAQQRKRGHLLHHGTLLYAFALERVGDYLKTPQRQPEYRQGRDHNVFLCNLPVSRDELVRRLREVWVSDQVTDELPVDLAKQLVAEKYGSRAWIRRL
jgi:lipoate-protein ligase A